MKNLKFAKSVAAGILGLTLLSNCSGVMEKMGMNKCAGKKKESANSCSSKKGVNSCSGKKATNSCSAKKSSNSCSSNGCSSKK